MLRKIRHSISNGAQEEEQLADQDETLNSSTRSRSDRAVTQLQLPWQQTRSSTSNSVYPGMLMTSHTASPAENILGLHLVVDHEDPEGDCVFVHGLGGSAMKTWSWDRDTSRFWPSWLAGEEHLSTYRIFTFGYNSDFKGTGTNLNIIDFAKDLLISLLTFSGGPGESKIPVGQQKIIFIAHSMGGLVVKKAYILGKYDEEYADLMSKVFGMIFLGTPHRGSAFASILNNILASSLMGPPPKAYIADLDTQSSSLQDINEQFRTSCGGLKLASFYETKKTNFKVTTKMIVEKESSVLGYPSEMSASLNADHHEVCKYSSREEENYRKVRDVLKYFALSAGTHPAPEHRAVSKPLSSNTLESQDYAGKLIKILGIRTSPEDDLHLAQSKAMEGTCEWITRRTDFIDWVNKSPSTNTKTFWLVGQPAMGKTVLASAVVQYVRFLGQDCQHHFFTSAHQAKKSPAYAIRSIALQLAHVNEEFRERLVRLHDRTGITFTSQNQNFATVWDKIFQGIICKMRFNHHLTFVLDAVDECESQATLVNALLRCNTATPLRLFFTSRPIKMPTFAGFGSSVNTFFLSELDTTQDLQTYVHRTMREVLPNDLDLQHKVTEDILRKASGSFLWVKLTLEMLEQNWHTLDDIDRSLGNVPQGMESLYERMIATIQELTPRLQLIAKRILTWAACSFRPLALDELQTALEPEFKSFIKLEETITQVCGHFVRVDNGKVMLVHATARHFLLNAHNDRPAFVNSQEGHEYIATVALLHLSGEQWRLVYQKVDGHKPFQRNAMTTNRLVAAERGHPFLGYSTCYWAYHVSKSATSSTALMETLRVFFDNYSLTWIEGIALSANLRYLTRAAQQLKRYAKQKARLNPTDGPNSPLSLVSRIEDDAKYIKSWAIDLIRVAAKFGANLVQSPSSIYRLLPPFCPPTSMVATTFARTEDRSISVRGLPLEGWDDCLATLTASEGEIASKVLATETHFVVLICATGTASVWKAETCEFERQVDHDEYVKTMAISATGTLLVTAGISTFRVWDISTGNEVFFFAKPFDSSVVTVRFGVRDDRLIVGYDDCTVRTYNMHVGKEISMFLPPGDVLSEMGCPRLIEISPDLTHVAMAWRGKPPRVWDMSTTSASYKSCRLRASDDPICAPQQLIWQNDGQSILVGCQSTALLQWLIYEEEYVAFPHVEVRDMALSEDGNFLLTADPTGSISVWLFPRLTLLYQLRQHEFIRDIAFSPDAQRFYDTRGSSCNVWEPDILTRPEEHDMDDHSSVGESSAATEAVIAQTNDTDEQITAIACDSTDKYFCCGREDGKVIIHDAASGAKLRIVLSYSSTSAVILLEWSASGRLIAALDDSGRVVSKRLENKEAGKWAVFAGVDYRSPEPVQQLLFSADQKYLLVSTSTSDRVWDLTPKVKVQIAHKQWSTEMSRRWVEDPQSKRLLRVRSHDVQSFEWTSLAALGPITSPSMNSLNSLNAVPEMTISAQLTWAALTGDGSQIIYTTAASSAYGTGTSGTFYEGFSMHVLDLNAHSSPTALSLTALPSPPFLSPPIGNCSKESLTALASQIRRLFGLYNGHLVFLDHDCWLSTWRIGADTEDVVRLFFLPRDWVNGGAVGLACVNSAGTFLCPRQGNVAIVRNGLRI